MMKRDAKIILSMGVVMATMLFCAPSADASVRLKEIAQFDGARENQIMGYGIVVGLNGTGDKGKSIFTTKAIASMLKRMGLNMTSTDISVKNVAAVMVTATLPPFVRNGTKIDVTLSSLGDAKSLAGGILLQTPLQGADGVVYAVAQGGVSLGGMDAATQTSGFSTVARIPNGALVERAVPVTMVEEGAVRLLLFENDFTTCTRVAEAVNVAFGQVIAYAEDGVTVKIKVPAAFRQDLMKFVAKIERIEVVPDYRSKIIINERTGTIVGGKNARISEVSLTHLNINIEVESKEKVSSGMDTKVNSARALGAYDAAMFQEGEEADVADIAKDEITVGELARYLNSLGVGPKDMIAILHGIKSAGAIQADIEIL